MNLCYLTLLCSESDLKFWCQQAPVMLTCEICGEELLLEEDMKTHLLLSHLERELHCPLCSLSGVSFDELRVHVLSAHPEDRDREGGLGHSTCGSDPGQSKCGSGPGQSTCGSGLDRFICGSGSSVSLKARQNHTPHDGSLVSGGPASLQEQSPEPLARFWKGPVHEVDSESSEAEPRFSCPLCSLVCSSPFVLQDHVELHLQGPVSHEGQRRLECPMCSAVCSDGFSLQEHVELHLDHNTDPDPAHPDPDLELASQLQQEEELKRRQEEARQEKQEFKKLQRRFGVDGGGGYRRQTERSMARAVARGLLTPADFHCKRAEMMESLASGVDDGTTRTQGVLRALYEFYQTDSKDCVHVWLSADTDHYSSSVGDQGWGCGYRNFQMLLSSLKMTDTYSSLLQDKVVPCIPRIQCMIEEAWKEGLDPQGASHFNQRLQGTRAWIGATEIYVLLVSLGISARIIDFHQPTGTAGTHPLLFDWVKQYFCQSSRSTRLPPKLIQTGLPPLYLQHQGHSRSVVGLEQKKNGSFCLLVLDPGSSVSDSRKLLSRDTWSTAVGLIRKFPRNLKHRQYQLVSVQGVLSPEDKQMKILNSRTLRAERIP